MARLPEGTIIFMLTDLQESTRALEADVPAACDVELDEDLIRKLDKKTREFRRGDPAR